MGNLRKQIALFFLLLFFFLTSFPSSILAAVTYKYDATGNLISDGVKCYEYNDANQIKKVKDCSSSQTIAEYLYDYEGNRLIKKQYSNGSIQKTTYSPTDDYETVKPASGQNQNTTYYYADEELVAKRNPDGTKNFYHNDHLGSTSVLTSQSGAFIEETKYDPWGEVKSGGLKSKFLYTGQEKDSETGLSYYNARYYDPHTRRFTQPDSLYPDVYDPQQLNLYSYVKNNPLTYKDPSGHCVEDLCIVEGTLVLMLAAPTITRMSTQIMQNSNVVIAGMSQSISDYRANPTLGQAMLSGINGFSVLPVGGLTGPLSKTAVGVSEAKSAINGLNLTRSLAREAQMGEKGTVIAGPGARVAFRDADKAVKQFGGNAMDWAKKSSSNFIDSNGRSFETHWIENLKTGQRELFKVKESITTGEIYKSIIK